MTWKGKLGLFCLAAAAGLSSLIRPDIPVDKLKIEYATGDKVVDVDGLTVYYRDEGKGEPLVLLHGAASSLQAWDGWADVLSSNHRVIRLDLPGYGLTGPNRMKDYSMVWYVSFLDAFLDKVGVEKCALAGNSFGGHIGLEYAAARPSRVEKLVLVDASGYPPKKSSILAQRLSRIPVLHHYFRYATPRFFLAMNVRPAYGDPAKLTESRLDAYYDLIRRTGNRETFGLISATPFEDSTLKIRSLRMPTLILWGEKDVTIPPENAERFHKDIPGSRVVLYPGVGHLPMEEAPTQSARDVEAFLTSSEK